MALRVNGDWRKRRRAFRALGIRRVTLQLGLDGSFFFGGGGDGLASAHFFGEFAVKQLIYVDFARGVVNWLDNSLAGGWRWR